MPRSISGRQNQPRSGRMTRRSWASASMAPMPNAWPLSAAAVGTGNVSSRVSSRSVRSMNAASSSPARVPRKSMSKPFE